MSVHCGCGGDHEPWQHPHPTLDPLTRLGDAVSAVVFAADHLPASGSRMTQAAEQRMAEAVAFLSHEYDALMPGDADAVARLHAAEHANLHERWRKRGYNLRCPDPECPE